MDGALLALLEKLAAFGEGSHTIKMKLHVALHGNYGKRLPALPGKAAQSHKFGDELLSPAHRNGHMFFEAEAPASSSVPIL